MSHASQLALTAAGATLLGAALGWTLKPVPVPAEPPPAKTRTLPATVKTRTITVSGSCSVNNSEALCQLVRDGLGIARLPTYIAGAYLADGRLQDLFPDYSMPSVPLVVVLPERRYLPQRSRAFVDFLAERFAVEPPPWEPPQ